MEKYKSDIKWKVHKRKVHIQNDHIIVKNIYTIYMCVLVFWNVTNIVTEFLPLWEDLGDILLYSLYLLHCLN